VGVAGVHVRDDWMMRTLTARPGVAMTHAHIGSMKLPYVRVPPPLRVA
jgi:hypothetical protein